MPDYSKGKIYKIYSYETDDVYYGSTVEPLSHRIASHRYKYKKHKEGKIDYYSSYEILKYESAKIELVENYPCNSKEELLQREGYYIRNNKCVNKYIPDRTQKEYCETNKDKRRAYCQNWYTENIDKVKKYREENKDKINEKFDCECGSRYTYRHKTEHLKTQKHINYINSNINK